jgi:hypothetical protein
MPPSLILSFQHRPRSEARSKSKLETAYYKTDKAVQNMTDFLAAEMLEVNSQTLLPKQLRA